MKNTIYIFLVFVLVFFLNLLLYIYVDGYREIIKTLKYGDDYQNPEIVVDDSYNVNSIEFPEKTPLEKELLLDLGMKQEEALTQEVSKETETEQQKGVVKQEEVIEEENTGEELLTEQSIGRTATVKPVTIEILQSFRNNSYELGLKTEKDDLLDIAREYPDEYIQYGNEDTDLYVLSTRNYAEVLDIFRVLEFEMPFTLNVLNNFGTQSFFINLDRPDRKVRFIFEYKGEVYGMKVRTTQYNAIKNIINNL